MTRPSASTVPDPLSPPPATLPFRQWAPLVFAVMVTLGVYAGFTTTIPSETSGPWARDAYYNRLVDGLTSGHLYLAKETPPSLLALPDPYDREKNGVARGIMYTPAAAHDLTYYHGKLYLYFSVIPAVLLFLPYHVLTGAYVSHQWACLVLASFAYLTGAGLLVAIWRRAFPSVSAVAVALGLLAFGLAPLTPVVLQRPDVYEVPICSAFWFTMLALGCIWRLTDERSTLWKWSAALSGCVGLALGSRPSDLLTGGLLVVPFVVAVHRSGGVRSLRGRSLLPVLAGTIGPVAVIGASLLAYNAARFGSPFEFGIHYQLNGDERNLAPFGLRYLAPHFRTYFLSFPGVGAHFPYAGTSHPVGADDSMGLISTVPFVLVMAVLPLAWRRWEWRLRIIVAAIAWVAAANAALMLVYYATAARYQMSFAQPAVLLAVIGLFVLAQQGREWLPRPVWLTTPALLTGLVVFSATYDVLAAVRLRGASHILQGTSIMLSRNDAEAALVEYRAGLRLDPEFLQVHRIIGSLLASLHRPAEAIAEYQFVLAKEPDDAETMTALATLLVADAAKEAEAEALFRRSLQLNPAIPQTHNNLGVILERHPEKRAEAIAQYLEAIRLDAQSKPSYQSAIRLLAQHREQLPAAVQLQRRLLTLAETPDERLALERELVGLLLQQQRVDDALRECDVLLQSAPADAVTENLLGVVLGRSPRPRAEALAHFRTAIRLKPDWVVAHYNLGLLLAADPAARREAIAELQTALRLQPDLITARKVLDLLLAPASASGR